MVARQDVARALVACAVVLSALTARAGEVTVAVASNFAAPMQKIAAEFEARTQHHAKLAIGSTGAFHTQIRNGAPFDVLLAADDDTPARLEQEGLAVPGSRFTYATGRLVLWSAQAGLVDDKGAVLLHGDFRAIAIADPRVAPYGRAAVETMRSMGVYNQLAPRIVQGENIGQAFQFVATGNAELGFVALSQVMADGRIKSGSAWIVPAQVHAPLRQDAVILKPGRDNPAARQLMQFLAGETARGIMRAFGYQT